MNLHTQPGDVLLCSPTHAGLYICLTLLDSVDTLGQKQCEYKKGAPGQERETSVSMRSEYAQLAHVRETSVKESETLNMLWLQENMAGTILSRTCHLFLDPHVRFIMQLVSAWLENGYCSQLNFYLSHWHPGNVGIMGVVF